MQLDGGIADTWGPIFKRTSTFLYCSVSVLHAEFPGNNSVGSSTLES